MRPTLTWTRRLLPGLALAALASTATAADLVALSPQTWDRYAPRGKEADAIYGDFTLANDRIVAVVARPVRGRHANMTVREVGGCLIDLTSRDNPSDQLSAFYPGAGLRDLRFAGVEVQAPEVFELEDPARAFVRARRVTLRLVAEPRQGEPDVSVAYSLEDGDDFVTVTTTWTNRTDTPISVERADAVRADRSFEFSSNEPADLFWAHDRWFGQCYGVVPEGLDVVAAPARQTLLRYQDSDGKVAAPLVGGQSVSLTRRVIPAADLFAVRRVAERLANRQVKDVELTVEQRAGGPVAGADVLIRRDGQTLGRGRTDHQGRLTIAAPAAPAELVVSSIGHGESKQSIEPNASGPLKIELPTAGLVDARITGLGGGAIPCKIQFVGLDDTSSPDFGPDSGEFAVGNLIYTPNGMFQQVLMPGRYRVLISYGPEYDAVTTEIEVKPGVSTPLTARLIRTVKTDGWISADFHSHSTPSGDNTASQLGRVLNLLCEHVEFAPCTEHNRIDSYVPHLERLGVRDLMATCSGMESTGRPLPLNHQNAFPLIMRPHTQDNGAPSTDEDPEIQIERLALWDNGSDKLVQVNHPDIGWMFFDRNGDGNPDSGFQGMVGKMDVVEVHPPDTIFGPPLSESNGKNYNNTIFNWLQLLNLGHRIPGVVNTDAHYNLHGSGWLRNYLKSPTDDPAKVETMDMVHAAERGHVVISNGPFLEVSLRAEGSDKVAIPGDDLAASSGRATLHVRVQCPNWFDVDRVQVFLNGRAVESLNFTRASHSDRFSESNVRFESDIPLTLERDTHVIVATIGENSRLGEVMGPDHGKDRPVAVSNPIFVDVDGSGFTPSKDTLGAPLPVKGGR